MSTTPYVGALTAFHNSAVAMTVNDLVYKDGNSNCEIEGISCQYFIGAELQHAYGKPDAFIGFGDSLVFEGGAFHEAFNNRVDDEAENELLDEDEEEEEELEGVDPAA